MKLRSKYLFGGTLALLGSVAFAQTLTFATVLEIATKLGVFNSSIHPTLERGEAHEADDIKTVALAMYQVQSAVEPKSRDAHAKGHGCAQAEFTVDPSLPAEFQVGTFANPGQKFEALIRFSNGAGTTQSDAVPGGRGMAIKLLGAVKGGNILGTGDTQDFMLINNPEFFIRSIHDYALFQSAIVKEHKVDSFILGRAIREALADAGHHDVEMVPDGEIDRIGSAMTTAPATLPQVLTALYPNDHDRVAAALMAKLGQLKAGRAPLELKIIGKLSTVTGSMVTEPYFSMSSYLYKAKTGDTAVKYVARPVDCQTSAPIPPKAAPANASADLLRVDLNQTLQTKESCYAMAIQPLPADLTDDQRRDLVEDSRLDYNSPEIPLGRLVIPVQTVDIPSKQRYCENLSYNPWQTGPEHQPLGAMNRVRKVAVTASSIRRHLFNGTGRHEPLNIKEFSDLH